MKKVAIAILILTLISCARQGILTGGDRDEEPPQLLNSQPKDQTINFEGSEIILEFDELITVNQIKQQLLITPTINDDYEVITSKNTLTISNLKFQDSTTYTFNFRQGLVDLNEKNPANLRFAISTGPYIDSLKIAGTVKELQSNKPVEEIDILLYNADDTLTFFKDKPIYLTKSDSAGHYEFQNLKPGNYRIYANEDINGNGSNQSEEEAFAFLADTIRLTDSTHLRPLLLQRLDVRPLTMTRSRPFGKYFEINFKKYLTNYTLTNLTTNQPIISNSFESNRKIRVFNTFSIGDTIQAKIVAIDSLQQTFSDTLKIYFQESKRKPETFTMSVQPQNRAKIMEDLQTEYIFNKPIAQVNIDSINIFYDTLTYNSPKILSEEASNHDTRYYINYKLKTDSLFTLDELKELALQKGNQLKVKSTTPPRNVILKTGHGAFISVEGDSSKRAELTYKMTAPNTGASIYGEIKSSYPNFLIELSKEGRSELPITIKGTSSYSFKNLTPGKYTIKFLIDENGNGVWDQGNILKDKEPELIIFPKDINPKYGTIPVNSGWEVEQNYSF